MLLLKLCRNMSIRNRKQSNKRVYSIHVKPTSKQTENTDYSGIPKFKAYDMGVLQILFNLTSKQEISFLLNDALNLFLCSQGKEATVFQFCL